MEKQQEIGVQIVDQIESAIKGAPPKLVVLSDDGHFFIGRRDGEKIAHVTPPVQILAVAQLARAIVAGDQRAMTAPGGLMGIATALLVALYHISSLEQFVTTAPTVPGDAEGEAA